MASKKKKTAIASLDFTFKGTFHKKGVAFKGSQKEREALINKNLLKWQL